MTWNDIAKALPEFVEWVIAKHGPLTPGKVTEADYERLRAEYEDDNDGT